MVLVALEWLRMRMRVDRSPWADVVVSLGVLGVEDFKDGAGGVVRWGWANVPGSAWVDGAGGAGWLGLARMAWRYGRRIAGRCSGGIQCCPVCRSLTG